MHKKYMEEIIKSGNKESMECLAHVFDVAMEHLEECDHELYEKLEMKLYVAINGEKLDEKMAEKIIMEMQPYHMRWSLEQTKQVQKDKGLSNIDSIDFWIVMNMAANDYSALFGEDIQKYVEFTKLFIEDPDAKEGKVFRYFTSIPE